MRGPPGRALRELERVLFRPQCRPYAWARLDAGTRLPPPREFGHRRGLFGVHSLGTMSRMPAGCAGIEGDYNWTRINGSADCGFASCETRNNWLSTVRGRIGMPFDRFLPYLTGGVAFGDITASNSNAGFGTASTKRPGGPRGRASNSR